MSELWRAPRGQDSRNSIGSTCIDAKATLTRIKNRQLIPRAILSDETGGFFVVTSSVLYAKLVQKEHVHHAVHARAVLVRSLAHPESGSEGTQVSAAWLAAGPAGGRWHGIVSEA